MTTAAMKVWMRKKIISKRNVLNEDTKNHHLIHQNFKLSFMAVKLQVRLLILKVALSGHTPWEKSVAFQSCSPSTPVLSGVLWALGTSPSTHASVYGVTSKRQQYLEFYCKMPKDQACGHRYHYLIQQPLPTRIRLTWSSPPTTESLQQTGQLAASRQHKA